MRSALVGTLVGAAASQQVESTSGTIKLAYSDCGDSSTHGKFTSLSPTTVTLGQKTALTGKGSLDKAVSGASYTVDAYGPFNVHVFSHSGDACKADTIKLPMGTGTIDFHGFKCPMAKGDVELSLDLNLTASIPASLAKTKINLKAKSDEGEKALCAEIKTSAAADAVMEEDIAMTGHNTTTHAPHKHHTTGSTTKSPAHHHTTTAEHKTTPMVPSHHHDKSDHKTTTSAPHHHHTTGASTKAPARHHSTTAAHKTTPKAPFHHHNKTEGHKTTTDAPHHHHTTGASTKAPAHHSTTTAEHKTTPKTPSHHHDKTEGHKTTTNSPHHHTTHASTKAPSHRHTTTAAAHKAPSKASFRPLEVPEASSGIIKLTYNDCGDATTRGKFTSLSPTTVTLGQKTTLKGKGSLDEAVSGAGYTVDAYGPFNVHLFSHSGDACKADTIKLPMGTGTIDFHGLKCPVAKGAIELDLDLNLAGSIPASLAKTKIDLKAKTNKGEKALCAEIHTSAAADVTENPRSSIVVV